VSFDESIVEVVYYKPFEAFVELDGERGARQVLRPWPSLSLACV
jgi:hypothetical protein